MHAIQLIHILHCTGYTLKTDGHALHVTHRSAIHASLRATIEGHAPDLVALLTYARATSDRLLDIINHGGDYPTDAPIEALPAKVRVTFGTAKTARHGN